MQISIQKFIKESVQVDGYVQRVFNGEIFDSTVLSKEIVKTIQDELKRREYEGREGEVCVLPLLQNESIKYLILIGVGKKRTLETDNIRVFGARAVKAANGVHIHQLALDPSIFENVLDVGAASQALAEGVELAAYNFSIYRKRTAKEEAKKHKVDEVIIYSNDNKDLKKIQKYIDIAKEYVSGTFLARDLVNTPSMHMYPNEMAKVALGLVQKDSGITCKVYDKEAMAKFGMQASLAVGQGSAHEPKFVHLIYKPKTNKKVKKIALVGKAVTFDSGGLSIKPADGMIDMKIDMAGAATVIGVFKSLVKIKPNVEVHGIFIAVENMPSGAAYRPGDVVSAMDGTTIEVENTDAEGRITLADALAYAAVKIKPDYMIDLATLTGAVIIALGSDITGMFCSHQDLKNKLQQAAKDSGELMWELPLHAPYRELIKSKIADVRNVGGRPAGVITAALFLEKFVQHIPWAHLDIAGPSYAEKENKPELPVGGTGWGVRMLLNLLREI